MANKPSASEDAGILEELVEATGVKYKTGESAQDYAKRLALAVDKLADADWKAMSEPAQLWANAAVVAADDKKDIDLLPGMVEDDAGEEPVAEADDAPDEEASDAEEPVAAEGESEEVEEPEPKSAGKKASSKKDKKESVNKKPAAAKQAAAKSASRASGKKAAADKKLKKAAAASDANGKAKSRKPSAEPRAGTKRAKLIEMLSRTKGATVAEIAKDFGWEPHTTRASISMVRKAGAKVASEEDGKRGRVYRIEA